MESDNYIHRQKLFQYRMLLEDYLRHLPPSSSDFDDTTNALRIVSEAAEHANDTVKQGVRKTSHVDNSVNSFVVRDLETD